jgi:multidrug efflux pump subunit AcrA (membrane-fusion protein)
MLDVLEERATPASEPPVSDVLSAMPSWAARGLIYIITASVFAAVVWASLSSVDVTVESRGVLVPDGYVRPVQSPGGGLVQHILVREGDEVAKGQPLVQLDAADLRARLTKLREELQTTREELRQLLATHGPVATSLEQQNRIARLETEIASTELGLKQTTITAPVGGIVTNLNVRSAGTVLQAGEAVSSIAPAGVRLVVIARVPNKDMTFIEKGLPAKLKFDAFPYQDYGVVESRVVEVSPDSQEDPKEDKDHNSFYRVTILPLSEPFKMRPGLTLSAEIITERRTVMSLILEPFRKLKGSAR